MSPARKKKQRVAVPAQVQAEKGLELLFEIGCEEIPAGMVAKAADDLKAYIEKVLTAESIGTGVTVETFGGPRRLTVWAQNLPRKQADVTSEVTGPPKSVAYDSVCSPTRAAVSFAEKQGVALHEVFLVTTPKGEYLAAKQVKRGRTAEQVLADILPRAVHDLAWERNPFACAASPSTRRSCARTASSCALPNGAPKLKRNSRRKPKRQVSAFTPIPRCWTWSPT